jgi:hypothetical protein
MVVQTFLLTVTMFFHMSVSLEPKGKKKRDSVDDGHEQLGENRMTSRRRFP